MLMRKKMSSPALSQKSSLSPRMGWRADGSPYLDLCPPTPQWGSLPSVDDSTLVTTSEQSADLQIAWAAYQGCSRRMNSACIANRAQSLEEQRAWWEETSSICRNAMLLHNATLTKQYDAETAKNLGLLEDAHTIVQRMLQSLSSIRESPLPMMDLMPEPSILEPNLFDEDPEPIKHSKFGISMMLERFINYLATREPRVEVEKVVRHDTLLYD